MEAKKLTCVCISLHEAESVGLVDAYVRIMIKDSTDDNDLFLIYTKDQCNGRVHAHIIMDKALDDDIKRLFNEIGYLAVREIEQDSLNAMMQYLVK